NKLLIETEVQLGRRSETDLGEVRYAEAQVAIEILNAEQSIKSAGKQLGILLYGDSRALPEIHVESAENAPAFIGDWQRQTAAMKTKPVLERRGDVSALRKKIEASTSERKEAYWSFVPDLDLRADYTRDFSRYASNLQPERPD